MTSTRNHMDGGIQSDPESSLKPRFLEKLVVLLWVGPLLLVTFSSILSIYAILCTNYGFIPLLYLAWLFYDRQTCNRGGRRSAYVRRLGIWTKFCDYFSMKLIKTTDLDPSKNFLFCAHPHGVFCIGVFGSFGTEGRNVAQVFPDHQMSLLTLEPHCLVPVHREYLMLGGNNSRRHSIITRFSFGICSASKESMNYLLSQQCGGQAVVLLPGGAPEALDSRPNSYVLHLKNRKGFIKVALRNGASLVPVFTFGETDIFDQVTNPEGSFLRMLQNKILMLTGGPLVLLKNIFPNQIPITTVVGEPIQVEQIAEPSQEDIDLLHSKYVEALSKLFYSNRNKYAPNPNVDLTFI